MRHQTMFQKTAEFSTAADQPYPSNSPKVVHQSTDLVHEEYSEWSEESPYGASGNLNDLKECLDLIYACSQYMNSAVGPEKAELLFSALHTHNMEKCVEGKIIKSPTGKIIKSPGFNRLGWLTPFKKIIGIK